MFNHPRDRNFNPNDNTERYKAVVRYLFWSALTHFVGVAAAVVVFRIADRLGLHPVSALLLAAVVLGAEAMALRSGAAPTWLVLWSRALRFRRRWHRIWTSTAHASSDHTTVGLGVAPIVGIIPTFAGSVVSWSVRPPAGSTLEYVAELADTLASHSPGVHMVEVLYDRPTDSRGEIQIVFGEPNPITNPDWGTPPLNLNASKGRI